MLSQLLRRRVPGQLVIQMTDQCNARCPQCGMRKTERFERSRLSGEVIRRIIDAAARKGVQALSFTGGEPMLFPRELADLISYAGAAGIPYIRTGTNGFFFANSHRPGFEVRIHRIAEKLARTPLRNFWISIDSALPEVHEQMRGFPGVIAGIERALPIFHSYGIWPSANLGINRNISAATMQTFPVEEAGTDAAFLRRFYRTYREAFRAFYRFVTDLGFTIANCCYPMSVENQPPDTGLKPVYAASSEDRVVKFLTQEKAMLFKALMDVIPEFRSQVRIFSPRTSLYALYRSCTGHGDAATYPCRGGIDFFFINAADGNTYPCGYRGDENLGRFWDLNLKALADGAECRQCDWECFRDPSELFGPLLQGLTAPLSLIKKLRRDPRYLRLWSEDLRYYRACGLFDGRKPLNERALARFGMPLSGEPSADLFPAEIPPPAFFSPS